MPSSPALSVIIPMRAGEYPQKALACLSHARQPQGAIEVLLVEGTAPSWQRNEAVARASAEILYFLDDDSYVAENTLIEGLQLFTDPSVSVVGGPAITHSDASFFEKCVGEVISSPFGGSITRARNIVIGDMRAVSGEELVLCNLMIRKTAYEHVSGLDTRLHPGEDPEFIKRLNALGMRMYYHPRMVVSRTRRQTIPSFAKQAFRYGRGRGLHILEGIRSIDLIFFLPLVFSLYLLFLPLMASNVSTLPFLAYVALSAAASTTVARRSDSVPSGFCAFVLFPILHVFYGAGTARGLFEYVCGQTEDKFSPINVTVLSLAQESPQEATLVASAKTT